MIIWFLFIVEKRRWKKYKEVEERTSERLIQSAFVIRVIIIIIIVIVIIIIVIETVVKGVREKR